MSLQLGMNIHGFRMNF